MNIEWLQKSGSSRLILIFGGWSTDASFYSHISQEGWDVAVVSGYSDLVFPYNEISRYSSIALFAWSMGVFVASRVMADVRVAMAVAVNGTEFPVDDSKGIPSHIFEATAENLSERNLLKFHKRMSGDSFASIKEKLEGCGHDIEMLRHQLEFIAEESRRSHDSRFRWHRVYVSADDLIFPCRSQLNAWRADNRHPEIVTLDSPHFVDLLPIVRGTIPSVEKVGDRFHKAVSTYDATASAQRVIAERLTEMSPDRRFDKIVEIGPGTGLFSRMIMKKCKPGTIEYVDLYPLPHFGLAPAENYHSADAEIWIEEEAGKNPDSYDAVVSASAIQWFADPGIFFRNARRLLRPGGMLLCSTFLPDNLRELGEVSPYRLVYRSRNEIENYLKEYFGDYSVIEDTITLTFGSSREMLLHLSHTGVGGATSSGVPLRRLLESLPPRLTYRPLLIRATV